MKANVNQGIYSVLARWTKKKKSCVSAHFRSSTSVLKQVRKQQHQLTSNLERVQEAIASISNLDGHVRGKSGRRKMSAAGRAAHHSRSESEMGEVDAAEEGCMVSLLLCDRIAGGTSLRDLVRIPSLQSSRTSPPQGKLGIQLLGRLAFDFVTHVLNSPAHF